jgi:purine nucleosidase
MPWHEDDEFNMVVDITAAQVVFPARSPLAGSSEQLSPVLGVMGRTRRTRAATRRPGLASRQNGRALRVGRGSTSGWNLGETYALGDNPLVLPTALQSAFNADPSSTSREWKARPTVNSDGTYGTNEPSLPPVRVFTSLDTRLMFEDMFVKFGRFARSRSS